MSVTCCVQNLDGRALKVNTARYGGHSGRGRGDSHFGRGGFRGDFRGGFRGGRWADTLHCAFLLSACCNHALLRLGSHTGFDDNAFA